MEFNWYVIGGLAVVVIILIVVAVKNRKQA